MAVLNNYEVAEYVGDDNANRFNFSFRCLDLDDLVVVHIDSEGVRTILVRDTDYSVENGLDNNGGTIIYPIVTGTPLLSKNESIRINRDTKNEQLVDFEQCRNLFESTFDKGTMQIQEIEAKVDSAFELVKDLVVKFQEMTDPGYAIQPQTIINGAVGSIPAGWLEGWCDKPAEHIITSGSSELTIQRGLQVAAGVRGKVFISNELDLDTTLDITFATAQTNGRFYLYTDIDTEGGMSFGYNEAEPQIGLNFITGDSDFYNTANHTHYDKDSNILKRVYLGEFKVTDGVVEKVINYQHGTTVTIPVNDGDNVTPNLTYYLDKPYLGYCTPTARIYYEDKWGKPGHCQNSEGYGYGVTANCTDSRISLVSGTHGLANPGTYTGGEFSTTITGGAQAKVTIQRGW